MNIIKNGLFSILVHGLVLVCCFALPAHKLIPLFQSGNSALTLTSLSISVPDKEHSSYEPNLANEEEDEEDNTNEIPINPKKRPIEKSLPKHKDRQTSLDTDALLKGVSAGLSESAGIRPYYPLGARLRGEQGVVKVEVCVGSSGQVLDCAVVKSSGYPTLDNAALKAVKLARFISSKCHAIENQARTVLTFRFALVD